MNKPISALFNVLERNAGESIGALALVALPSSAIPYNRHIFNLPELLFSSITPNTPYYATDDPRDGLNVEHSELFDVAIHRAVQDAVEILPSSEVDHRVALSLYGLKRYDDSKGTFNKGNFCKNGGLIYAPTHNDWREIVETAMFMNKSSKLGTLLVKPIVENIMGQIHNSMESYAHLDKAKRVYSSRANRRN